MKSTAVLTVGNVNNPYDSEGQQHNTMLISFIDEVLVENNNYNPTETGGVSDYQEVFDHFEDNSTQTIDNFTTHLHKDHLELSEYSASMITLYNNNTYAFNKYFEIKNVLEDNITAQAKINEIKLIEADILADNLNSDLEEVLLTASSIARWSIYLWISTDEGGLGKFDEINNVAAPGVDGYAVARADVWGAATGAFSTANPFVALGWGAIASGISAWDQWWAS